MRRVVHILTRPDDALARVLIDRQKAAAGNEVEVVNLTRPDRDYKTLLEKIFAADSVESW
jgi:hypothetical protein